MKPKRVRGFRVGWRADGLVEQTNLRPKQGHATRDFSRCVLNENVKVRQITKFSAKNLNCRADVALDKEAAMLQSCRARARGAHAKAALACAARPPPFLHFLGCDNHVGKPSSPAGYRCGGHLAGPPHQACYVRCVLHVSPRQPLLQRLLARGKLSRGCSLPLRHCAMQTSCDVL